MEEKDKKIKLCELCQREIDKNNVIWIFSFENLERLNVCEECDLSIDKQIDNVVSFCWKNEKT